MRSRALLLIVLGGTAVAAPALDARQKLAQSVVRDAIRRRYGAEIQVNFTRIGGDAAVGGEYPISGRGYTKDRRQAREAVGDFSFAVRVREDAASAREIAVDFVAGGRVRERGPIAAGGPNPLPPRREGVVIEKPKEGFADEDGNVSFAGRADGSTVLLSIRGSSGAVVQRDVPVRDGKWSTEIQLDPGAYRLTASARGRTAFDSDSVNFVIRSAAARDEDRVILRSPERPLEMRAGNVRFEGTSVEDAVRVRVYDSSGRQIRDRTERVSRGRWTSETTLERGSYRLVLSLPSGRDTDEIELRVR